MKPGAPARRRWRLEASAGDAVPVSTIVNVVERPIWERLALTVQPPAYAQLEVQEFTEALPLTVLPGTAVSFSAIPLSPTNLPAGAQLQVDLTIERGEEVTTEEIDRALTHQAVIDAPQTWRALPVIRFPDGSAISANEATPLRLSLRRDEAPVVGLSGVTRLESVTPNALLPLLGDMRDDFWPCRRAFGYFCRRSRNNLS